MLKYLKTLTALIFFTSMHGSIHANIIGVLTESIAIGTFRNDANGNPITASFSGPQISEQFGGTGLGSAAIFDTTSRVGVGVVEFKNGNASYGNQVLSVSRTVVDVSFENTGNTSIRPTLNSQITPAGMGLYVSGCSATNLRNCALRDDGDYDWQDVGNEVGAGMAAVGSRFDFKVVSEGQVLFELSGGLSLVLGENGSPNTIVTDLGDIEGLLTDFRMTSPVGSQQQISFDWGATDFLVEFPLSLILAPGEFGNLSYITEVTTFSNAFCFGEGRQACPIAYGAFGDPIGRGGAATTRPNNFAMPSSGSPAMASANIEGIDIGLYQFNFPTFENGEIGFRAISGPGITSSISVPEPAQFGLLALGFAYLMMRRKQQL